MTGAVTPGELLEFWFGPTRHAPERAGERMGLWFSPGAREDQAVREHFEPTMRQATVGLLTDWLGSAEGRLALVLALDQAPRVIFRRQAEAFACDGQALALTLAGIAAGIDRQYGLVERAFFYMPLEHSEDPLAQQLSVTQFEELAADFPEHAEVTGSFLKYARDHAAIIERFGRFPHRNDALGRASTAAEARFLENGPRYGQ